MDLTGNNRSMMQYAFKYSDLFHVAPSPIHGKGLFTEIAIPANESILFIGDFKGAANNNWISHLGRHVNHDQNGNCHVKRSGTQFFMYSSRDIGPGEELTSDYTKLSYPFKNHIEGVTNK